MKRRKALMIIVTSLLVVGAATVWYFVTNTSQPEGGESQVSTSENEENRAPTTEEIEELVSKLSSQDQSVFLDAWIPGLEGLIGEEVVRDLMVPQGSVVTTSDPLWSDDCSCWTINATVEVSDSESIERTLLLELTENQWRIYGTG